MGGYREKDGVYKHNGDLIKQCENWQMGDLFPGVDKYKVGMLKEGQELVKLGGTNSPFFTTMGDLEKAIIKDKTGNRKYDSRILNESIQVAPWFNGDKNNPKYIYRAYVEIYKIKKPIEIAYGKTEANKQYGEGGAIQVVIPDSKELIKQDVIEKETKIIKLNNYDITREEYEKYEALNEQQILKRNLMSNLYEKSKLMEMSQNEKTKDLIDKIDKNINLLKEDIEDITDKVRKQVESPSYDTNIKYLEELIENKGEKNLEIEEDIISKQDNLMNKVLNERTYFPKTLRELGLENKELNIEGLIDTYNSNQYRGKETIKDLYNISKVEKSKSLDERLKEIKEKKLVNMSKEKIPIKREKTNYEKLIDRKIKIKEAILYIEMKEKMLDIAEKSSKVMEKCEGKKEVLELKGEKSKLINKYKDMLSKAKNAFNITSKELEIPKEENTNKLLIEERNIINSLKKDLHLKLKKVNRDIDLYKENKSLGSKQDNIRKQKNIDIMNKTSKEKLKKMHTRGFESGR